MTPPIVLFAMANDARQSLLLAEEERAVRDTLATAHDSDLLKFYSIGHTTLPDIYSSLNRFHNSISIFHFAGHSSTTHLQLEDQLAGQQSLSTLLGMAPQLKLVFLNGCSNAGQVRTLHQAGVEAVIATSVDVDDKWAKDFSHQFYQAMAGGKNITDSFQTARRYVSDRGHYLPHVRGLGVHTAAPQNEFPWGLYYRDEGVKPWHFPLPQQLAETIASTTTKATQANFQLDATVAEYTTQQHVPSAQVSAIQLETHDQRVQNSQGVFRIEGEVLLGRGPTCDIVILERGVSRQHARFVLEDGQLILLDENSTNGTFWNQIRVSRMPITQEGILSLHNVQFRVRIPQ